MALVNLEKVSASLGSKGVLWELFSFSPAALKLYVDLCAWSQFLSDILINNPGMIDDLLDSLILNQPRTGAELRQELHELCRKADDPDLIIHSFQDKELLRIGVRDILAKDTVRETTAALSDLAEVILAQIADLQSPDVARRFGAPYLAAGPRAGQPARFVLLGLGKLGGREMSYHSDLDLVLVYEGDGRTGPPPGANRFDRSAPTDNFHYFTELAQRIIRATSLMGPRGRLYQVDMRLRPTGRSGSLVTPLAEFERYYASASAHLWERQALTRARVVYGDADFGAHVMSAVEQAAYGLAWTPRMADEIFAMRERIQASGHGRDLKRGYGGLIDIEFLVQLYRLKYGSQVTALRTTNTWDALAALRQADLLDAADLDILWGSLEFLRLVESRLRIVHNRSLDELPEQPDDLDRLARRLDFEPDGPLSAGECFLRELDRRLAATRDVFLHLIQKEKEG
jgi:glutamate-ammonia-ligase adenylyltransferase